MLNLDDFIKYCSICGQEAIYDQPSCRSCGNTSFSSDRQESYRQFESIPSEEYFSPAEVRKRWKKQLVKEITD